MTAIGVRASAPSVVFGDIHNCSRFGALEMMEGCNEAS